MRGIEKRAGDSYKLTGLRLKQRERDAHTLRHNKTGGEGRGLGERR